MIRANWSAAVEPVRGRSRTFSQYAVIALALVLVLIASAGLEARGDRGVKGREFVMLGGQLLTVYTYRPRRCSDPGLLFVFAGYARNARGYRGRARRLADKACLIVIAPKLDRARFPRKLYQRAGVGKKAESEWRSRCTGGLVSELVAWGRLHFGRPNSAYYLFGHSAGGQLLSRVAAYCPPVGASRIVIANPSVYATVSTAERPPYGFRGLAKGKELDARLAAYLAQPVSIYLGSRDTGRRRLLLNRAARRQGANRLDRGRAIFAKARALAEANGWEFNWRLVEVRNVGHSSRRMLRVPEAMMALGIGARSAKSVRAVKR
jgi:pimeloyl-ACP methyl ester carboxylesterase